MLARRGAGYTFRATAAVGGRCKPEGSPDGRVRANRRPPVAREDLTRDHNGCPCQTVPISSRNDFMPPRPATTTAIGRSSPAE
ncbi:hypothetical protein [Streptomyces noursei]|uniref:hypothetical protein n=1 Tax=Streptomyces noursei TaxID=1971 RepID=UPI0008323D46